MKTLLWFMVLLALSVFSGCSGSGDSGSGDSGSGDFQSGGKSRPAVNEKSVTESAKDYLMNPVRQKKKAVKELNKALAKRDSDISRQLDEITGR